MRLELLVVDKRKLAQQGYDTYVCRSCNWCARVRGGRVMRTECSCIERVIHVVEWNIVYTDIRGMDFGLGATQASSSCCTLPR